MANTKHINAFSSSHLSGNWNKLRIINLLLPALGLAGMTASQTKISPPAKYLLIVLKSCAEGISSNSPEPHSLCWNTRCLKDIPSLCTALQRALYRITHLFNLPDNNHDLNAKWQANSSKARASTLRCLFRIVLWFFITFPQTC